jgi:hypothetical protein
MDFLLFRLFFFTLYPSQQQRRYIQKEEEV